MSTSLAVIVWLPTFFPVGKARGYEGVHATVTSSEVKDDWNYASAPPVFLHCLDRDNFTFHWHILINNF